MSGLNQALASLSRLLLRLLLVAAALVLVLSLLAAMAVLARPSCCSTMLPVGDGSIR